MKVCKKCKKKVANKSKICRYCGADVTKCRIIKEESKKPVVKENKINKQNDIIKNNENTLVKKQIDSKKEKNKENKRNKFSIKECIKKYKKKNKVLARKVKTKKEVRNLKIKKIIKICVFVLIVFVIVYFIIFGISKLFNIGNINVVKEGTYNNVFKQGDKIKYKDVIYQVSDVWTSMGTDYKKPKEGNQYVVVTIEFENDSDQKVRYSYKDWKMINSLGEEKNRIFTPVNVSTALYSGNLVIGGKKTGSIVFEEPIGDNGLMLNYYEYKEENVSLETKNENNDILEEEKVKPVFSIKIDVKEDETNQV